MLRHKLFVAVVWLAATAAGAFAVTQVGDRLVEDFAPAGSAARDANRAIDATYRSGGESAPTVPVIVLPEGRTVDDPAVRSALGAAFQNAAKRLDARVVSYADTGDRRFVGADGRTTFGLVYPRHPAGEPVDEAPDLSKPLAQIIEPSLPAGSTLRVTGMDLLADGAGEEGVSVLTETLVGGVGALLVLAFVFGSFLALVPLLIAVVSILGSFLAVYGLTELGEVNFLVQFVVALIGLGVAVDYSLLLVTRWREERARGQGGEEAVHRAMATAGRSVVFSGVAVSIGLIVMLVLPVPFLRSIAYGGVIIPSVSVLATLTLLPIILATAGSRLDWPRLRKDSHASRAWAAWTRGVVRFRFPAALGAIAVLVALALGGLNIHLGEAGSSAGARSGPAHDGLVALRSAGIGSGVLTPVDVLVPPGGTPASAASRLADVAGVRTAVAPSGEAWRQGGSALLSVIPVDEGGTNAGHDTVRRIREAVPPGAHVGGEAASDIDFVDQVYGVFPWLLGLIALLTFVLLARAFRSLVLPLKAVALNLLSLAAALGSVTLIWQEGHGSDAVWGVPATGAIGAFIPCLIFAFLYGLSMDYEVFILARIREEYERTGSTEEAIVEGLGRTGRLVTSAALILCLAFASMAAAPMTEVKVFATGLGLGILLDATIVRGVLVPALIAMFGDWNWWLPGWAARLLRVAPSGPASIGAAGQPSFGSRST
ncbi:MMPL family transporter [Actinomadura terrae]|uniref:MMPL family transporter n=1 Tax=Actinomadura terrae TaxID=604353 RepID=UPI001FA7632E|nr:MMPL family transporter [Actinomadura terrae]